MIKKLEHLLNNNLQINRLGSTDLPKGLYYTIVQGWVPIMELENKNDLSFVKLYHLSELENPTTSCDRRLDLVYINLIRNRDELVGYTITELEGYHILKVTFYGYKKPPSVTK